MKRSPAILGLTLVTLLCCCAAPEAAPPPVPTDAFVGYEELLQTAQREGVVRVTVELNIGMPFQPEGELDDLQSVEAQRDAIRVAQHALLESLADHRVSVHGLYEAIPFMALEVDDEALRALIVSPLVASIVQDKADAPSQ